MEGEAVTNIASLAQQADGAKLVTVTEPSVRPEPIPFISIPQANGGVMLRPMKADLDAWRTSPERITGTAKADTLRAFTDLVNRHKSADSALFGSFTGPSPKLSAVIDYHTLAHAPAFGGHRIVYAFPMSPEWLAWSGQNGKPMSQLDWAAFVEEHIADLASPMDAERSQYETLFQTKIAVPSELIQLSRGMQIAVEARVKDVRVLQSGEAQIEYEEVHKDGSGAKLTVPGLFVVSIPLFIGGDVVRVIARLRYRRAESKILWFYQLYRPDLVIRAQLENDLAAVADETKLPAYEASPEQ